MAAMLPIRTLRSIDTFAPAAAAYAYWYRLSLRAGPT
jgi:hypothetical protein